MNQQLRENKAIIRDFMRAQYGMTALVNLLDDLRSAHFSFFSCCCFIGRPTANHRPMGFCGSVNISSGMLADQHPHYARARELPNAIQAEGAAANISRADLLYAVPQDDLLRRRLIPLVLAEIRRRRVQQEAAQAQGEVVACKP